MNYSLKKFDAKDIKKLDSIGLVKRFSTYIKGEESKLSLAVLNIFINSVANIATPLILGFAIDHFITHKDLPGLTH